MPSTLVFVYNADTGLFNRLTAVAHKLLRPSTYACQLCKLTHGHVGAHDAWRTYIQQLPLMTDFLHRDEFARRTDMEVPLPAIFWRDDEEHTWSPAVSASQINQCESLGQVTDLIDAAIAARPA